MLELICRNQVEVKHFKEVLMREQIRQFPALVDTEYAFEFIDNEVRKENDAMKE